MRTKLRPAVAKRAEPRRRAAAADAHSAERERLAQCTPHDLAWKRWGPYLSERQWGTVREDYSANGDVWGYFPHDHARSRAYRWGEDGLAGFCDHEQRLCLSLALWNGRDPILKERLFGLTNGEGNHGEDVKELYYYLDATPTHSYLKMLYKYPQREYPVRRTRRREPAPRRAANRNTSCSTPAYSTEDRYFDVFVEYAKADVDDMLMRVTVHNRGPEAATLHVLPQLVFRNTWCMAQRRREAAAGAASRAHRGCEHRSSLARRIRWSRRPASPAFLFTDNDTNTRRLYGVPQRRLRRRTPSTSAS